MIKVIYSTSTICCQNLPTCSILASKLSTINSKRDLLRGKAHYPCKSHHRQPTVTICSTTAPSSNPWSSSAPQTARIAFRTGLYITIIGVALTACPISVMSLLFNPSGLPSPGWIRVGGVLASLFGFYYIGAAYDDTANRTPLHFYQTTVYGRFALSFAFSMLVATKQCEVGILWLAVANFVSSVFMQRALDRLR